MTNHSGQVECVCGHVLDLNKASVREKGAHAGDIGPYRVFHYTCPQCQAIVAEFIRADGTRAWAGCAGKVDGNHD